MSFDSTKYTLEKMLEQVDDGTIQLPEFQRDYVWDEDAVVSLLASIAKGYPVGALLLRADDFHAFFADRAKKLSRLAAEAMQKEVIGVAVEEAPRDEADDVPLDEEETPVVFAA